MIVVAGGTGRLGSLLVSQLVANGLEVKVMTREIDRARHLPAVVEVIGGDVRDRESVDRAVRGSSIVVSAVQGFAGPGRVTPASVDRDGNANLVDAAVATGAAVVLMSVVGAAADSPMELFRAKAAAERHLQASGAAWTIVRATAFVELWAEIMAKPIIFGRGDNPINFVSVSDVASVLQRAVSDANLRGQVLEVGGPENVTFNELAALLQSVQGSARRYRHIPRPVLRVLGRIARQPRAAVAMDTLDMTFDAPAHDDLPMTDLRTALSRATGTPDVRTGNVRSAPGAPDGEGRSDRP